MKPAVPSVFLLAIMTNVGCNEIKGPVAPLSDVRQLVKGNTDFALALYAKLKGEEKNLFFSPHSISTALAMTWGGARGQTATEMAKTLRFSLEPDRLHPAFATLDWEINGSGKPTPYQLYTANALWSQKDGSFLPEFIKLVNDQYHAGLNQLDFQHDLEAARQSINFWVDKQTKDKIRELFAKGVLSETTRLVLTNAIYFKGKWEKPFKERLTLDQDFNRGGKNTAKIPFMNQNGNFGLLEEKDFQALEMPYGDGVSMVIFLPVHLDGLKEFEKKLTEENLTKWLGKLKEQEVNVKFPKVKMTQEFQLNQVLSEMGMSQAFNGGQADFSGINGNRDFFLSAVIHKAFVEVNEEGTEAAAATGVVMPTRAIVPRLIPTFRADHPFFFLIRKSDTNSILFMGRFLGPEK